jgi:NAD(P)H-hydrate epimerase
MQDLKGFPRQVLAGSVDVRKATKPLDMHWNKYSRGSVLIVAGSTELMGAMKMAYYAANNAMAALRTVSGYVTVAAPKDVLIAASDISPVFVIKELDGNVEHDMEAIRSTRHDAIILGPGIPKPGIEAKLIEKIVALEKSRKNTMVIDGAMISEMAKRKALINERMILTPHTGEFKSLTGVDLKEKSLPIRVKEVEKFVNSHNCTLLLKGNETIVSDGKRLKLVVSKTPALATMGTGDVLCGIIASYAASNGDPFGSAVAGAYVNSVIGDTLFKEKGEHITAIDVIEEIPKIIKEFDKKGS